MTCTAFVTLLAALKEVVVTGAALVGAIVAIGGLSTWRRQLAGKQEYEVALRLLRASYKVRDAISTVRNPLMTAGEMGAALIDAGQDLPLHSNDREAVDRATALAYQVRWNAIITAMEDLDVARVEAEVLWGQSIVSLLRPLKACVTRLRLALEQHLRSQRGEGGYSDDSLEGPLYWISDDPTKDAFSGEVQSALEGIEQFVRPKLKA